MTGAPSGTTDALESVAARFDALVDATPASDRLDHFCSSTDWIVPLHRRLGTGRVLVRLAPDGADAALAVTRLPSPHRRSLLCGLDVSWGYARPVVGPDRAAGVGLVQALLVEERSRADGLLLTGVARTSAFGAALVERLGDRIVAVAGPVGRRIAWLDGDFDAFLRRRSASFRRNVRQARRRAMAAGVCFEWFDGGGAELVQRAVAVERSSWKGREGSGLAEPSFAAFYLDMAERLAPSGRLRAGFARLDGRDVGFILGAVRGTGYRGLQLAYDAAAAPLSLGNLLQLGQLERLAAEGIERYDLGQDMPYKAAWSDEVFVTETVVLKT
ncbi:MAG: GNAT family N-acetyltransferase [Acidimicrobiia bacterium]